MALSDLFFADFLKGIFVDLQAFEIGSHGKQRRIILDGASDDVQIRQPLIVLDKTDIADVCASKIKMMDLPINPQ